MQRHFLGILCKNRVISDPKTLQNGVFFDIFLCFSMKIIFYLLIFYVKKHCFGLNKPRHLRYNHRSHLRSHLWFQYLAPKVTPKEKEKGKEK